MVVEVVVASVVGTAVVGADVVGATVVGLTVMADEVVDALPVAVVWVRVAVPALPDPLIGVPGAVIADVACVIETAPLYNVGPGTTYCSRGGWVGFVWHDEREKRLTYVDREV
jgi:hypothetical protein